MTDNESRTVLVTGASSGLGLACAEHLVERGYRVFGTSRSAPESPIDSGSGSLEMIRMDVDQDESVQWAVDYVMSKTGRIDVVVNNAGFGISGAVEDTPIETAKAQLETNFFGVLRVCHAVLPAMRERGLGYIVNVTSLGGVIAVPFQGLYCAAKFAVEGMSEALRMEVRPFGVHVVLVEPGDTRTQFTFKRVKVDASPAYEARSEQVIGIVERDEQGGSEPEGVAHVIARIIENPSPRIRYRVGSPLEKTAAVLKGILPSRVFEWLIMNNYKLV